MLILRFHDNDDDDNGDAFPFSYSHNRFPSTRHIDDDDDGGDTAENRPVKVAPRTRSCSCEHLINLIGLTAA